MAIHSSTFGRVTLTDDDARKFEKQVRYGKPKAAAIESVRRGVTAVREYQEKGSVRFTFKSKAK